MAAKIIAGIAGSFGFAYACDLLIAEKKLFGGRTPKTVSKDWWEETEKKFQAWPLTARSPVAINTISRQNFIVRSRE